MSLTRITGHTAPSLPVMNDVLARWQQHMRTAATAETTIELRLYQLRRAQDGLAVALLDASVQELEAWLSAQDWKPATRRSYRAALRAFYKWAVTAGLLDHSPAHELPSVRVPRGLPRPAQDEAYEAALATADDRIRRAIRLGAEAGLRRGEIARVRAEDVEPDLVGWALRVIGKGGHVRLVPLDDDLAADLRAAGPGWVFPSSARPGHLTPAHLGKLVSRTLPAGVATHALRHRAGTKAYAGTTDLRAVQEFLGHAKPETTALYTEVPRASIRAAMRAAVAA